MSVQKLAAKLVKVMGSIGRVAKNGQNDFHKYAYAREADILEEVRTRLVEHNVLLLTSVEGSQKDGDLTSVVTKHTFIDGDSGETLEVRGFGQGADKTGDKGGPKAITSAVKYMLMKTLLIPTGDDPEASDETGKATGSLKAVAKAPGASADKAPAKTYGFSGRTRAAGTPATPAAAPKAEASDEF